MRDYLLQGEDMKRASIMVPIVKTQSSSQSGSHGVVLTQYFPLLASSSIEGKMSLSIQHFLIPMSSEQEKLVTLPFFLNSSKVLTFVLTCAEIDFFQSSVHFQQFFR